MKAVRNAALVIFAGAIFLFFFTSGLKAFTSEGVRRLDVERNPISIPDIKLDSADGNSFSIIDYHGKIVLVDFIFTSCTSVCPMLTQNFQKLHKELQQSSMQERVVLLTISFDPDRDSPAVLKNYASAVGADSLSWKFATVNNRQQLQEILDVFGIIVIPAPNGQYEHNSAIHLVNQYGELAKIYDYDATSLIMQEVKERYRGL